MPSINALAFSRSAPASRTCGVAPTATTTTTTTTITGTTGDPGCGGELN